MKIQLFIIYLTVNTVFGQIKRENRFEVITDKLTEISVSNSGYLEQVTFNVQDTKLPDFVRAIANMYKVDIAIDNNLNNIKIHSNFSNATVKDILVFLCKEYHLTIDFTGNIVSLKKYVLPKKEYTKPLLIVDYNKEFKTISFELKQDTLFHVFKKISNLTNKNLVFAPGMENITLTSFINKLPLESALEKLAFTNNLSINKTRKGNYIFEKKDVINTTNSRYNKNTRKERPTRKYKDSNFYYRVIDTLDKTIEVDFENTSIASIIKQISQDLQINTFTTSPLDNIGTATVTASELHFDDLLNNILENTDYSYKRENDFYFFGEKKQEQLQKSLILPLQHRSINIFSAGQNTSQGNYSNSFNSTTTNSNFNNSLNNNLNNNTNTTNNNYSNNLNNNNRNNNSFQNNTNNISNTNNSSSVQSLIPTEYTKNIELKIDEELNSFIVTGAAIDVNKFKEFITYIDKPVPIILIEVMIIETEKSINLETGVELGVSETPTTLTGSTFPSTNISLGANEINRIIGGFDGFGLKNLGKVIPNFYATIKSLETNGSLSVKSTPKLATLNSHTANLSIGETSYYAVTQRNIIGSQNPQISEVTNYQSIDAQLGISLTPIVSGNGTITLNINVVQSDFNGTSAGDGAPPGLNSREFSSAIRVKNNDMIILGGLEEKVNSRTNKGVPLLSRIPILRTIFSSKSKEDRTKKLSILIKPTLL